MIEEGEDDFVSGDEIAAESSTHGEGKRGHVGAEDDFVGIAIEKVGHGGARFDEDLVGIVAGLIGSVGVGVVAGEIVRDGVDDALGNLRAAGAIEKDGGISVDSLAQGGELRANPIYIEGEGRRRYRLYDWHSRYSNADAGVRAACDLAKVRRLVRVVVASLLCRRLQAGCV